MRKLLLVIALWGVGFGCGEEEEPVVLNEADNEGSQVSLADVQGAPILEDTNSDPDVVEVDLRAQETTVELGEGNEVDMFTYNGHLARTDPPSQGR